MEFDFKPTELIKFLQDELAISKSEIAVVLQQRRNSSDPLPMLLWQYGLVSLEQLQQIFDWFDNQTQFNFP
ncbi:MAG: DUF2949 domain-containing protein [Prochloraceae cyanobacterium]